MPTAPTSTPTTNNPNPCANTSSRFATPQRAQRARKIEDDLRRDHERRGRNTKKYAQNGARVKTGVLKTCFCIGILFIAIGFEGTGGEDRRRGKEAGEEEEEEEGGMTGNNIYERICKKARVITYA